MMVKKSSYILAALVIIAAVFVVGIRLLTPVLDEHKKDIEAWATTLLKLPVSINKVRLSWYQYQPEVTLHEVTLLNKAGTDPLVQIRRIKVFFSIPKSIWQRKLVPSGIMVTGADLNIYQKLSGEIAVQGFPVLPGLDNQPYKTETSVVDAMTWLSQMPRLILNDIDLHYKNKQGTSRFVSLKKLRFENSSDEHVILGKAVLHQDEPTELAMTVKWQGESTDITKANADVYLTVSGLSLAQWWKGYDWHGWHINAGMGNAKIWTTWTNGTFEKIQSVVELYDLQLYSATDKSMHVINRFSGEIGWKREGQGYVVAGDDIFIDLPEHLWPSTSFYLMLMPDATGQLKPMAINLGYVNLADIQTFAFASPPLLPPSYQDMLKGMKLTGDIQSIALTINKQPFDWAHTSLTGQFSRLSFVPWKQYPGMKHVTGGVQWDGQKAELTLESIKTEFTYAPVFLDPLSFDRLTGHLIWRKEEKQLGALDIQDIQVTNADMAIKANGTLILPLKGAPIANINTTISLDRVSHVSRYLPLKIFDPALVKWLQTSFLAGTVTNGVGVLRGPLDDFPFDKGTGEFKITVNANDIKFHYAPDWPLLDKLNAKVVFSGRQMQAEVASAMIGDIKVNDVHGNIPYLGEDHPSILTVQTSDIDTDFALGLRFVHASPLEKTIGRMFSGVDVKGPLTMRLDLTVPLSHPDDATVRGEMTFKEVEMNLRPWHLVVDQLHGGVQFTEKSTDAASIQGRVFNKPLQLVLKTIQKPKVGSIVRASVANQVDVADLEKWLDMSFKDVATGSTAINGTLDFSITAPMEVLLQSNLIGININLPDQYAKKPSLARNFSANIIAQEKQPLRVRLNYGGLTSVALLMQHRDNHFSLSGANLRLGNGDAAWPASSGLYVTGVLPELDWEKIKSYMDQSNAVVFSGMTLTNIDVTIAKLVLPGQTLMNTRVQLTPSENNWDISLSGSDIDGDLQIPKKLTPHSQINMQFQKLRLNTLSSATSDIQLDFKSVPAISFTANDVTYNKLPLGQVSFKAAPSGKGIAVSSFAVNSPRMALNASGNWSASGTTFQGKATSPNVSQLLNSFGFDAHNFVASKGQFDFNLSWNAAPYAFSLASLNGKASLDIAQGRIVEIGQTGGAKMDLGRMLSIFSLQTIPRRLSLDFSDVFQKGYSFDLLRGDFKFTNGDAYTSNMHFEGPVARVDIYGRIGLAKKDYDLTLSVTPHVTSSIPVAATLITGQPAIGIAAWAVDKVLSSGVSKATTYYYSVDGLWSNPSWNSIAAPTKRR